jgi:nucleotide-binding universal stress UspA family protein
MFKRLVVPMDFSEAAVNAAHYAAHLAAESNGELLLFHAVQTAIPDPYVPAYYISDVSSEQAGTAQEQMDSLTQRLKESFGIKVSGEVAIGDITASLADFSREQEADVVVMGTHGAHHWLEKLVGTNTTNVVNNLDMPLLVVPEGTSWKGFSHLLCASDFSGSEENIAEALLNFAIKHQPEITFVHVRHGHEEVSQFNRDRLQDYVNRNLNMKFIEKTGTG